MSIIYEALQKVEQSKDGIAPPKSQPMEQAIAVNVSKPKNTKILFFLLAAFLFIALISFLPKYYPKPVNQPNFKNPIVASKDKISEKKPTQDKTAGITEPKIQTEQQPVVGGYLLQGIVYDEQLPSAIINGKTLRVSDSIDGLQVKEITPTTVKLVNPKDNSELALSF